MCRRWRKDTEHTWWILGRFLSLFPKKKLKYERLTYGISSAPFKFQNSMESLLSGMEGVIVFLDDILVTGQDEIEHLNILRKVLTILKNSGLNLSSSQSKFFQNSVEYLGNIIDEDCSHTSKEFW